MNTVQSTSRLSEIVVQPEPRFALSPYMHMQFMEPLGTTDSSVEAGWDFQHDCWREDLVQVTRELAPGMIRWGGCLSSYYRWKEGVGPRSERVPMLNLLWGGVETNQIGTGEFVDFCRRVGAEPLLAVNFESDGRKPWAYPPKGEPRTAGPEEAAEWIDYCNNPSNALRRMHGVSEPYNVRFWQIGNETSYDPKGYDLETSVARTVAFAQAMRQADSTIKLIGWGDSQRSEEVSDFWAPRMLEGAGEYLDYIAMHHMYRIGTEDPEFDLRNFRSDPARTWEILMNAYVVPERKIRNFREALGRYKTPVAMTEGHFAIPGRNRNELLSSWGAGVSYARIMNMQARNGDMIKICTNADFCGTRWMVNAVMIPTPQRNGGSYLMPVARVMQLFGTQAGEQALDIAQVPSGLDITASRTGDTLFLHVVNTNRSQSVPVRIVLRDYAVEQGTVHVIAADPTLEVDEVNHAALAPRISQLPAGGVWECPPASVSAVVVKVRPNAG